MSRNPYSAEPTPHDHQRHRDDCPTCGKYVQTIVYHNVARPNRGVVRRPWKYMPCGHFVNPDDKPRPTEWTSETPA